MSNDLAKQFLQYYYNTIMNDRNQLINFYTDGSTMTYNGSVFKGLKEISEKVESFSFQKIEYRIDNQDVQDGPIPGSLLVFVTGALQMDGENTFNFSQVFNVCPNGSGGFYCHNDIFSLVM